MTSEHTQTAFTRLAAGRPSHKILAAVLLTAVLAGCKHSDTGARVAGWTLVDPAQRHPIIVSQEPQVLPVHVARGSRGLSPRQRAAVLGFADKARASDAGNSRLIIAAPSGSRNEISAMHAVGEIRRLLSDRGFPENLIQVEAYFDEAESEPPVRVSYLRYMAEGPQCGQWPTNLATEPQNLPHPNLGCANQRNLAAMVANPADLLGPRTESERASERREQVFRKYTVGESSVTNKTTDEKISVKEAGS